MDNRKKELQAQQAVINQELSKIEDKESAEAARAMVGKHFRFDNSYGSGTRWYLYRKVIAVKGATIFTFDFQITSFGELQCNPKNSFYRRMYSDHEQISKGEWEKHWRKFQARMASFAP